MMYTMTLGNEAAFEQSIEILDSYRRTHKVKSATLGLLMALLYFRKDMQRDPSIPMMADPVPPIQRRRVEIAADDLFAKIGASDSDRPVLSIMTGGWHRRISEHPDQNTWRNAMDTQAGFGCVTSPEELEDLEYVVADRSMCPHRDEQSRRCLLSDAACHNPTKKGGSGPTRVRSLPKILLRDSTGIKIVTLHPMALKAVIGPESERIPTFPFVYALYHRSILFEDPESVDLRRFTSDFGLDSDATEALFDTDPRSALNRRFLKGLEQNHLVQTGIALPEVSRESMKVIEDTLTALIGLSVFVDGHLYLFAETPTGYAIHNNDLNMSFDALTVAEILLTSPDLLDNKHRDLFRILGQSTEISDMYDIAEEWRHGVLFKFGERDFDVPLNEISRILESEAENEVNNAIQRGEVLVPVIENRETDDRRYVTARLGQDLIRKRALKVYGEQCAMCSMNLRDMLIASHIVPWSHSDATRLDIRNVICLCSLHDKAFDRGYFTIGIDDESGNFFVEMSQELEDFLAGADEYEGLFPANLLFSIPSQYAPALEFLEYHRRTKFRG